MFIIWILTQFWYWSVPFLKSWLVISTRTSTTCLQFRVTVGLQEDHCMRYPFRTQFPQYFCKWWFLIRTLTESGKKSFRKSMETNDIVFQIWHLTKILLAKRSKVSQTIYTVWIGLADVFVQTVSLNNKNVPFPLCSVDPEVVVHCQGSLFSHKCV